MLLSNPACLFCAIIQIAEALVIVDYMCKSGLNVTIGAFDPILLSCDQNSELHMVMLVVILNKFINF